MHFLKQVEQKKNLKKKFDARFSTEPPSPPKKSVKWIGNLEFPHPTYAQLSPKRKNVVWSSVLDRIWSATGQNKQQKYFQVLFD